MYEHCGFMCMYMHSIQSYHVCSLCPHMSTLVYTIIYVTLCAYTVGLLYALMYTVRLCMGAL